MPQPLRPVQGDEVDNRKNETIGDCAEVIMRAGWPFYVTVGHLGVLFGQWYQQGKSPDECKRLTVEQCHAWANDQPDVPERLSLAHVGNDEVLELMLRDKNPADVNTHPEVPPRHDQGGIIDLGFQYGARIQAGYTKAQAFRECGHWLAVYYHVANPWAVHTGRHPDPIVGQLRYGHKCFADDTGPRNVCGIHLGDLIGQGLKFGLPHVAPALDKAAEAGYHFVRSWFNVPEHHWWNNKPAKNWDPRENRQLFREILAYGSKLGLTWHLASGGLSGMGDQDENEIFDEVGNAIGDVGPESIALFEACNEIGGTGDDNDKNPRELARLIQRVKYRYPQMLYSLSAAAGANEDRPAIEEYTLSWMQHYYYHTLRDGHIWDKLRHIYSMGYWGEHPAVRWLGWSGEPWGNGNMVSVTSHKEELNAGAMAMGAAMAAMARQAWAHMGGSSVILYDDPIEKEGFWETPEVVRRLPKDLSQFQTLSHSGSSQHFQRVWEARGNVRGDYAIHSDGRMVGVVYGPPNERPNDIRKVRHIHDEQNVLETEFGKVVVGRV
jgi:hypothetical protein